MAYGSTYIHIEAMEPVSTQPTPVQDEVQEVQKRINELQGKFSQQDARTQQVRSVYQIELEASHTILKELSAIRDNYLLQIIGAQKERILELTKSLDSSKIGKRDDNVGLSTISEGIEDSKNSSITETSD